MILRGLTGRFGAATFGYPSNGQPQMIAMVIVTVARFSFRGSRIAIDAKSPHFCWPAG